ncbi:hypothetical protein OG2516_09488 [Oceanicola granulosus HTCC2516]|uniref:Excinuclease ABC subunit B n=1 Tax=Oceanicola granulosus (strain ATCC BAA-861 / DSM 15982 / KCTC 12143 / HTCC2516) TaxID=314256 RepID=Q2CDM9_OCEGH|nr:hypothetical protein [Oceanicola granulosus]EAR50821.1 hypothetical protein OG2516_09488 [Oceanicola granulosus HTCC2516]
MTHLPKLLLLLPLALAACATPLQRCVSSANSELRTLTALANEARGNLQRGYAVEEYQELRESRRFCEVTNAEGETVRTFCRQTEVVDRERAQAIDLDAERVKLRQLESRIAREQDRARQAEQVCLARYP